jgi:uncharacterized protein (TIGR02145 family)
MNRKIFRLFAVIAFAVLAFTGCQKEIDIIPNTDNNIIKSGEYSEPAVIDGQTLIFEYTKNRRKGMITDETYLEQQTIKDYPYNATANSYRVIKVTRPNGRYFWIMIDNFKYNAGTGCYIYVNNSANLATYGRLYKWQVAQNNRTKILMKLPKIINGVPTAPIYSVYGRLPNFQDIKDLLETTSIGNLPSNGTTPDMGTNLYYDAFLAGREDAWGDLTKAYPTLAGWRDNMDVAPGNQEFNSLTTWGRFWTSELAVTGAHYPLEIKDDIYMWSAYINAGHDDRYSFSVRYVFEPTYQ